ncbi:ketopantoate reductase family protein [Peribacillus sp. SCS-155]|uniref:ketopantoate reductase family protein n=1 Tax=Peribacillus sedimenti TaxID=3115297 RepID=UPI0039063C76
MRILVVGAGAIGGYFGGRLVEKNKNVTFLVRENREKQLKNDGLSIKSVHGEFKTEVKTLKSGEFAQPFDVIILSVKSYHLQTTLSDIKRYVHRDTMILPLLNGIEHIQTLKEEFSENQILGGLCFIETTLDENGSIIQSSPIHEMVFGELYKEDSERITHLEDLLSGTNATIRKSNNIIQEMWNKYMFISVFSGVTTMFRSSIGPIREEQSGDAFIKDLVDEIGTIMRAAGAPIQIGVEEEQIKKIQSMGYKMKSSMLRDMEKGLSTEAEHIHGYLLTLANKHEILAPKLLSIYTNLQIYERNNLLSL